MPLPNEQAGFNLHTFRQTIGDPGRPYLFLVNIPSIANDTIVTAMARSTTLPGYTIGTTPIAFQGVNIKIGTTPEFADWTVNFLCDEAHELRRIIMAWQAVIYDIGPGTTGHSNEYKSDRLGVAQLARTGAKVCTYNMVGAFPRTVGDIAVGHDQNAAIEQFDVTFSYDYFVVDSDFGDSTTTKSMIRATNFDIDRGTSRNNTNGNFRPD
jgi:hypothetical protein